MSMTSVSLSCAIRAARSGGSSGGSAAWAAAGWPGGGGGGGRGGVHNTFGAGAVPAPPRTPGVPQPSDRADVAMPRVTGRNARQPRARPAAAAALYLEEPEGKRLRERLAEQLRVAPWLRYEGKGRPTKRERREIEKLRGE